MARPIGVRVCGRPAAELSPARTVAAERRDSMPAAKRNQRWSGEVTRHSNALDLEAGVFKQRDPRAIAVALKRSAEASDRRRSSPYRSAMSMLTFYINRAGKDLPAPQKRVLEEAKDELRKAFGRD